LYLAPLLLLLGFWTYTKQQEGGGAKVLLVSLANGIIHATALIILACAFSRLDHRFLDPATHPRSYFFLYAAEMIVIGGAIAAEIFGLYLYISSRWLNLNHNDAFSSMRRDSHRHFVRIRIRENEITLYPICLDRVPKREDWRRNAANQGSPPPAFSPNQALQPRLIEPAITIQA
jgi:hypothetical protein